MTVIRHNEFILNKDQRLQLKNESNFSFEVLKELIRIRPIELTAKIVDGNLNLSFSMTHGFSAVVLPESGKSAPYFADIDNQHYQRLNLDVDEQETTWLFVFDERCGQTLEHIASQPIVIKSFERGGGKKTSLLIAANSSFRIVRAEEDRVKNVVENPFAIPDALLRLVEIIDEEIPDNRHALELQKERAKTTKKMLEHYRYKQYTLAVKEEIGLSIAELDDYIQKVDAKIETIKFNKDGVDAAIFTKMANRMKQVLGTKKFDSAMSGIYKEIRAEFLEKELRETFIGEGEVFEKLINKVDSVGVDEEVLTLLNGDVVKGFFTHTCAKCGSDSVLKKAGAKYTVECNQCGNSLSELQQTRSKATCINNWNRANDTSSTETWLAIIGMSKVSEEDLEVKLKKIIHTLMNMRKYWKDTMPKDMANRPEYITLHETTEMIKFVKYYLTEKSSSSIDFNEECA